MKPTVHEIFPDRLSTGGWWFGIFLLGMVVSPAWAGAPPGLFHSSDRYAPSARSAAMGSAFVAVADDASALFCNPAGLARLQRGEINLTSDLGWAGNLEETATINLPLGKGGLGFAGSYLSYGTLEGRDELGDLAPNYGADRLLFQIGGGLKLAPGLFLGASLRGLRETLEQTTYSFLVPDLGMLLEPMEGFKIGLDYTHGEWGTSGVTQVSTFRSGLSWEGNLDSASRLLITTGNCLELNSLDYLQAGMEFSHRSAYFLRAGYQSGLTDGGFAGFSFGAGVKLEGFILDYAYLPHGELGDTHRFSLGYFLDAPAGASSGKDALGQKKNTGSKASSTGKGNDPASSSSSISSSSSPDESSWTAFKVANGQWVENKIPSSGTKPETQKTDPSAGAGDSTGEKGGTSSLPPLLTSEKKTEKTPVPVKSGEAKESLNLSFNIPPDFTAQGEAQEEQGHHQEALKLFQQAIQQNSRNATAWWDMGRLYQRAGQKAYAVHCYEKALELRPGDKAFKDWLEKYKTQ
jgi:hypothetical protein